MWLIYAGITLMKYMWKTFTSGKICLIFPELFCFEFTFRRSPSGFVIRHSTFHLGGLSWSPICIQWSQKMLSICGDAYQVLWDIFQDIAHRSFNDWRLWWSNSAKGRLLRRIKTDNKRQAGKIRNRQAILETF